MRNRTPRSRGSASLVPAFAALLGSLAGTHLAIAAADQSVSAGAADTAKSDELQEIVVTGSLIPQSKKETFTQVSVITAEDIQTRGFSSVADALQHGSFSTGNTEGAQYNGSFTPGAKTIALFGLQPAFTKILIDGRPLGDYPALYNGTDMIANIGSIPTLLIDSIDVLPGGQSSIYGSDAIAGVVNVHMKQKFDGPVIDARYGWDSEGGEGDRRFGIANSFSLGKLNVTVGGQYERQDPLWAFKRAITAFPQQHGTTPPTADRNFLVLDESGDYLNEDPANCANVSKLANGSVKPQYRLGRGYYCGTMNVGDYTIDNGEEQTEGYIHASFDVNDDIQVFAETLVNHDVTRYAAQETFYSSSDDPTSPYYYYEDPRLSPDHLYNVQHIFTPEEFGGLNNLLDKNTNNTVRATLGVQGGFGASNWKYDVDFTYTQNKLTEAQHIADTTRINNFFENLLGAPIGFDPVVGVNIAEPNYAAFYKPITPSQYASFMNLTHSYSYTEESLARATVNNSHLFTLPGGDAGIALLAEGGRQGWSYQPDESFLNGNAYLVTAVAGDGHRGRYAGTGEIKLPVVKMLTFDLSGRYDDYLVQGGDFNKFTYNIGLEFRPFETFLIRGRYGTAFKAPTLADEFQGPSGSYTGLTDYYYCNVILKQPLTTCSRGAGINSVNVITSGTPTLKPINAKSADIGAVWSPIARSSISVDYLHWKISDEVETQDADFLLKTEDDCREGKLAIDSGTCQEALAAVKRDANNNLLSVSTPKINVAEEVVDALTISGSYVWNTTAAGTFGLSASYTDLLKHTTINQPGDPVDNLFSDPQNTLLADGFKSKQNLTVNWDFHDFGATTYIEHYGHTPNYAAITSGYGTPGAENLGDWTIVNMSARYQLAAGLTISANVDNVFDRMPPADHTYPGFAVVNYNNYNGFDYDVYGRKYYITVNYKFANR